MGKKNKIILYVCMFILLTTFVVAPPPVTTTNIQQISGNPSLNIEYPSNNYFKFGEDIELHFHVYNSTGWILNDSVMCVIHLYNDLNSHILIDDLTLENVYDYSVDVNTSVLSYVGFYSYVVQCNYTPTNTSKWEAGFLSATFDVTYSGYNLNDNDSFIWIVGIIIALLIVVAFMLNEEFIFLQFLNYVFSLLFAFVLGSSFFIPDYLIIFWRLLIGYFIVLATYIIVHGTYAMLKKFNFVGGGK